MTDYWVSREKHYCKYCNAWIQGDTVSIKRHEQGNRHKMMVQDTFRQKRQAKSDEEHAQRELQKQLLEIEKAAKERFAQDLAGGAAGAVPPPPPPRPAGFGTNRRAPPGGPAFRRRDQVAQQQQQPQDGDSERQEEEEDTKGIYMVRGRVFLEGKRHEDKLMKGTACEIWVEDVEEWLDAVVDGIKEQPIPNTELVIRTFTLSYVLPHRSEPSSESAVRSDRLRIKLPEGTTMETAEQVAQGVTILPKDQQQLVQEQVVIDEDTGMGEWSTVSVREIDESKEAQAARRAQTEKEAREEAEAKARAEKEAEALDEPEAASEDAFAAYNPFGGTYKGIQIGLQSNRHEEIHLMTTRDDVEFKKKKPKRAMDLTESDTTNDSTGFRKSKKKKNKRTTMSE